MTNDKIKKQIDAAIEKLSKTKKQLKSNIGQAVADVCLKVQNECQMGMTNTNVNNAVSYGKRKHHPSLPNEYPAVDYGDLRRSITIEVEENDDTAKGRVGSVITNPPYPTYLEYGTSKMRPRPWLRPSVEKNEEFTRKRFEKAMKDSKQ